MQVGLVSCLAESGISVASALRVSIKIGYTPETEEPSNQLLDVETQLNWLREIGFIDVDCYWKWLEMALLMGIKPTS